MNESIDEELLELLDNHSVITFKEPTIYNSGLQGTDFFDMDELVGQPESQGLLLNIFKKSIKRLARDGMVYDKIAFIHKDTGPIGPIVFATQLSQELEKDLVIVKRWENLRFEELKVKGSKLHQSDSVLLIDDVLTTGSTQRQAINTLQEVGANVTGLLLLYVRQVSSLSEIGSEFSISYIKSILRHDDLESLGLTAPEDPEEYLEEDLIRDYVHLKGKDPQQGEILDQKVEEIITDLLEEKGKTADPSAKKGLKNLYFNLAMILKNKERIDKKIE